MSGAATQSVTGLAWRIANILGACSPKTMCRKVIVMKATKKAIELTIAGSVICQCVSNGASRRATNGSPAQPSPKLVRVMPNWEADRAESRC